jgi:hypothetical protein
VLGKKVAVLVQKEQPAGLYEISFSAGSFASGIYFYQLKTDGFIETRKMTLIK